MVISNEHSVIQELIKDAPNKKEIEKLVKGDECGIMFEGNVKVQEKDILAFYGEEKKRGEL
jgi:translation initiation factor IF-2